MEESVFQRLVAWLQASFSGISVSEARIMAAIDDLKSAVTAAETKIDAAVVVLGSLTQTVAALTAKVNAAPNQDAELESLATELNGHVASLTTALNAVEPTPAPTPTPVPEPTPSPAVGN